MSIKFSQSPWSSFPPPPGGRPEDKPDRELPAADHDPGGELPTVPTLVVDHDHEDADAIDDENSGESGGGHD